MVTFQVFSKKLNCDIQLKYDNNARLIGIEALTEVIEVDEQIRIGVFANAPSTIGQLKQISKEYKWNLTEIKPDLSFDTFWKRYANTNGSKKKSEAIWDKMSEKKKNQAMGYINKYVQTLGTTTQAYATTYLNGEYWEK